MAGSQEPAVDGWVSGPSHAWLGLPARLSLPGQFCGLAENQPVGWVCG
eukprot:COSAG01_NODE_841_length_13175_cov_26.426124_15_plen_48_part_00